MTLDAIKQRLVEADLDAYVVPHGNRFLGQDILPQEHKLKYLCGFSGSAGALIVTRQNVFLLVDGRYELQAADEVDRKKITVVHQAPFMNNICQLLGEQGVQKVGYDAWCFSVTDIENAARRFKEIAFIDVGDWVQIETPKNVPIFNRDVKYAGLSREEKSQIVAKQLVDQQADYFLLTSADSVSWLLNIYAHDLPYSPVVRAFATVSADGKTVLYGDGLHGADIEIKGWRDLEEFLQNANGRTILYDAHVMPEKIRQMAAPSANLLKSRDVCQILKAEKNAVEMQGMINCHIRDGVALTKFLCWLDENGQGQTELDVVEKLHQLRQEQALFVSESFATIAGFGSNGAIVHYQPSEKTNKKLEAGNLLLLDSGGQYFDGTTDVTRTVAIGRPSAEMIADFTQVLKAHIALAKARFPEGIGGIKLDVLARSQMWQKGTDYKHGTGHGVACFGNVHEGLISISVGASNYGLKANMVLSDEPGVYKENAYGIRIENLLKIQPAVGLKSTEPQYLEFAVLTKAPIDKRLIDKYLLTEGERAWLNNYHQSVYDDLAPHLTDNEKLWLKEACSPL